MGFGAARVFTASMASGDSLTSAIDLGGAYPSVYLQISSTPSNCLHQVLASDSLTGVFSTVYHPSINSSTVTNNPYSIGTSITGALVPLPGGFRFMKVFATGAMTNGATYKIYTGDE